MSLSGDGFFLNDNLPFNFLNINDCLLLVSTSCSLDTLNLDLVVGEALGDLGVELSFLNPLLLRPDDDNIDINGLGIVKWDLIELLVLFILFIEFELLPPPPLISSLDGANLFDLY